MFSWNNSLAERSRWKIAAITCVIVIGISLCVIGFGRTSSNYVPMLMESCETTNIHFLKDNRDEVKKLFAFVPPTLCSCTQLFRGDASLPEYFQEKFNDFQTATNKYRGTFEVLAGYTALRAHSYKAYVTMASFPFVKTVCETGFNAGHSTFGWLAINPETHVYSFDIGMHGYSRPVAGHLQKLFPGRLNVTWGDSTETLPEFHRKHPEVTCDLVIIDGGHTYDVAKADLDNFKKMTKAKNILILDDYPSPNYMLELGDVWESGKANKEIVEFFHCNDALDKNTAWYRAVHGFSVGQYLNA